MHNKIVEYAYKELDCGYQQSSREAAPDESYSAAAVYGVEQGKDNTACNGHCPVSIAASGYLNKAVKEKSHKE